jgi:hypothetical protein
MGKMRNAYKILAKIPAGKLSLGRFKYRWEDNTKCCLYEIYVKVRTAFSWISFYDHRMNLYGKGGRISRHAE